MLYKALWYPALPFALLLGGGRNPANRRERLGALTISPEQNGSPRIWLHASSVGEIEAMRAVVHGLLRDYPRTLMVVTTMTEAGRTAARQRITRAAAHQLAPFDCTVTVRSFLNVARPQIVLLAETELWPNFLIEAARAGARCAIINGRVSERSMRRYRYVRSLIADALSHAHMVLVQTEVDAQRYIELGAPAEIVTVTGNTKVEIAGEMADLRPALRDFAASRQILVAGSTAPGEERMVLNAYRNLTDRFPSLTLVLAPRHLDRAREIEAEILSFALPYVRASVLPSADAPAALRAVAASTHADKRVLLLDTMGELRALYRRAAIAFVGGSMTPSRGGQNLAEPAAVSVPVLFGPHYENQRAVGDALLEVGGGRVVNDVAEFESNCAEWLADSEARRAAGLRARRVVERLAGGVTSTINQLRSLIGSS